MGTRIVLLILIPPVLLFAFALLMMWLPLPQPFPSSFSGGRDLVVAIMTGILGIGYMIGLGTYLMSSFSQAGRQLDPLFRSRGLIPRNYLVFRRQYQGIINGRQVEVRFTPSWGLQRALLEMYVSTDLDMRMAIGRRRPLLDCRDCPRVDVDDLDLSHLQLFAEEAIRARRLLADPAHRATLIRLISNQEGNGFRDIYLQPGRIWLRAHPSSRATKAHIEGWLDGLMSLAGVAEGTE